MADLSQFSYVDEILHITGVHLSPLEESSNRQSASIIFNNLLKKKKKTEKGKPCHLMLFQNIFRRRLLIRKWKSSHYLISVSRNSQSFLASHHLEVSSAALGSFSTWHERRGESPWKGVQYKRLVLINQSDHFFSSCQPGLGCFKCTHAGKWA